MDKEYTIEEISKHNSIMDCWIIIDGYVFNVTGYAKSHPGGIKILLQYAGKDGTKAFDEVSGHVDAVRTLDELCIGKVRT